MAGFIINNLSSPDEPQIVIAELNAVTTF